MEMTGVGEAAQFVSVMINGTEMMLKLTGEIAKFTAEQIKQFLQFLYARKREIELKPETLSPGEMEIDKLLNVANKNNEGVSLLQLEEEDKTKFLDYARDNKVTFSFMYDANKEDSLIEVAIPNSQSPLAYAFVLRNQDRARILPADAYLKNATPAGLAEAQNIIKQMKELDTDLQKDVSKDVNEVSDVDMPLCIKIDKEQITGLNPETNVFEFKVMDSANRIYYVDIPLDLVTQNKDDFSIVANLNSNLKYLAYTEKGFDLKEDVYYDLRANRSNLGYAIESKDLNFMANRYYEQSQLKLDDVKQKSFMNKLTGEELKVDLSKVKDASKTIEVPVQTLTR